MKNLTVFYGLISCHSTKFKTVENTTEFLSEIKNGKIMAFRTKKDAIRYINDNKSWALSPIKVQKCITTYEGKPVFYRIFY